MDALKILEDKLELERAELVNIEETSVSDRVQARLDALTEQIEAEETAKREAEIHDQKITIQAIGRMIEALKHSGETEELETPVEE